MADLISNRSRSQVGSEGRELQMDLDPIGDVIEKRYDSSPWGSSDPHDSLEDSSQYPTASFIHQHIHETPVQNIALTTPNHSHTVPSVPDFPETPQLPQLSQHTSPSEPQLASRISNREPQSNISSTFSGPFNTSNIHNRPPAFPKHVQAKPARHHPPPVDLDPANVQLPKDIDLSNMSKSEYTYKNFTFKFIFLFSIDFDTMSNRKFKIYKFNPSFKI